MNTELIREIFAMVEANVRSRPSPMEFEMAYQIRVAIDRIRFAIKGTEQLANSRHEFKEAGLQLADALDRLESAERCFQRRFRSKPENVGRAHEDRKGNGSENRNSHLT